MTPSSQPSRVAVFASGNGSNLQALLDRAQREGAPYRVVRVVSDRPRCKAVERAREAGVPVFAHRVNEFPDKAQYEQAIRAVLAEDQVAWVVLAGYMRLVGPDLLAPYRGRMVNIHPSLLPAFPGKSAIADAFAAGVDVTGVTVHFVDEGLDTGPVIAQWRIPVQPGWGLEQLEAAIHRVEHRLYPAVVEHLVSEAAQQGPDNLGNGVDER
ncbi:MAG: phosphoribosylglycinamide formyltransferase [Alicyclobacillus sp.]|nr:phosphoribosylglycinamide formyltransferase [Alicyclobacillus sp.]